MSKVDLKIGELARRTGVTVRTLHHYHQIGLLVPRFHSSGSQRIYGADELERLLKIQALKQLGLSLDDVARCLDEEGPTLSEVLDRHAASARERIAKENHRLARLDAVRREIAAAQAVTVDALVSAIGVMEMFEKHYTEEQLKALAERKERVGEAAIQKVEVEWKEIFQKLGEAMDQGVDPSDPEIAALALRGRTLVSMFSGGDAGIERSLGKMYQSEPKAMEHAGIDPKVFEYLGKAMSALPGSDASGSL